jgi:enamine deaminase RidA (YjgF/YER057c/UK114 family)
MNRYAAALADLGLELPEIPAPVANFVPYARTGNLVFISGQVPLRDGKVCFVGKLGAGVSIDEGKEAARLCALYVLATLAHACGGDLDRVVRCVRLGGFVNAVPEFTEHPAVMNGASDLMVAVLGERGRHARAAVGVGSLPLGVAVEVDAIFEIA